MLHGGVKRPLIVTDIIFVAVMGVWIVRGPTHQGKAIRGENSNMASDGMGEVSY